MILRLEAMTPLSGLQTAVDIFVVAFLFYRILLLIKDTRAFQVVKGIVALLVGTQISSLLGLRALHLVLQTATVGLLVALPVVFQPELRRTLEHIGRARILNPQGRSKLSRVEAASMVDELVKACLRLARERIGALMVIERETGLDELHETGIRVDAVVSWELLVNIFTPNTPLHDGAVMMRDGRIRVAGAFLPLAEATMLSAEFGTRHRAAVGVTEQSDALAVVVSEETGILSVALEGRLIRHLAEETLREMLLSHIEGTGALRMPRGLAHG